MSLKHRNAIRRFLPYFSAAALCAGLAAPTWAVPSFARQTGMACAACHTVYPELTPFGREFKLNGYVLDNMKQITGITTEDRSTLALNQVPPVSLMMQISYTHTGKAVADSALPDSALAKNGDILFPQQASIFYAGKIANNLGAFVQLTYDGAEDVFGFDNADIRYARHFNVGATDKSGGNDLIVGVTVNDGPTVQDAWNTTVAWGFPYASSSTAPGPLAAAQLDGGLGQNAAGIGVYAWWNHSLYAELSVYGASLRGGAHPLDSTQAGVVHGASPYWRLAYEYRWDRNSLSLGTYGMIVRLHPGNGLPLAGPTDRYRDVAVDLQYQFIGEDHLFTLLTTYIDEKQTLDASVAAGIAANPGNDLKTLKVVGEYSYQRMIGGSLGYFSTTGSTDTMLYAQAPMTGSVTNSPDSRGTVMEINYLPWLNTKLQLQYVRYDRFNGSSTNYDGAGRNASDNDTVYLLGWLNF